MAKALVAVSWICVTVESTQVSRECLRKPFPVEIRHKPSNIYFGGQGVRTHCFVTFLGAYEEAANEDPHAQYIVVLYPATGGTEVVSDVQEHGDLMKSDEEGFEPAGELEEYENYYEESSEERDCEELVEPPLIRLQGGQWTRRADFSVELECEGCSKVLSEYWGLNGVTEFEIWKIFCRNSEGRSSPNGSVCHPR